MDSLTTQPEPAAAPTQKHPMDGRSIIKASWIFRDAKAPSITCQHPTVEGYQDFITINTGREEK